MNSRGILFLTGATGHTGCRVARRLLEDGWALRCLVRTPGHARHLPESAHLEIVAGDLSETAPWAGRLTGCDAFLNLAHIGFAEQVIEVCRAGGVRRAIALSSTRRFTRFPDPTARRVIEGETAFEHSGLDYTILRPTMIFGGERDNNLQRVAGWLRRWRFMPRVSGGRFLVQPIYVWDLVAAVAAALDRPDQTRCRALTLAGPEPMAWRAMIGEFSAAMGRPVIWVPVPYWAAMAGAAIVAGLMKRPPVTRATVRRLLEDKAFPVDEAREALGGWSPRPFGEALAEKLAGRA